MAYKIYMELVAKPSALEDWKWDETDEPRGTHKMDMLVGRDTLAVMLGQQQLAVQYLNIRLNQMLRLN